MRDRQAIKSRSGPVSLILERSPPPVQSELKKKTDVPFNAGRVAFATWNGNILTYPYHGGTVGFLTFSSKYVMPKGLTSLVSATATAVVAEPYVNFTGRRQLGDFQGDGEDEVIASASDEEDEVDSDEMDWGSSNFNTEEYQAALVRSQKDLTYYPNRGMSYTKVSYNLHSRVLASPTNVGSDTISMFAVDRLHICWLVHSICKRRTTSHRDCG